MVPVYTKHEFGSEIYSRTSGNKKTYYATEAHAGSPHSVTVGQRNIPSGTTLEATFHTHPNNNNFSSADMTNANNRGVDNYVIGPNLNLQRYNVSTQTVDNAVAVISPKPLTAKEKSTWQATLQSSWYNHLVNGVCPKGYGCEKMTWPTP